jgi:3-oxoacyl-[acyl-carrier protein] reductase
MARAGAQRCHTPTEMSAETPLRLSSVSDSERFLEGRVAVVTGAGRGIGRGIATAYARAGATVVLAARTVAELHEVAAEIKSGGGRALVVPTDVMHPAQVEALFARVDQELGGPDLLVANAGGTFGGGPVEGSDLDEWRATFTLNVDGVYLCARAAIPQLRARGGGKIIVMGSGAGRRAGPGWGSYASAKAAVAMLVRVLAQELRGDNIAVNEIVPGPVRTVLIENLPSTVVGTMAGVATEWFKTPDAVADLALYLARLPNDGPSGQTFSLLGRDM